MKGDDPILISGACNTSASEIVLWLDDGSILYGIHNLIAFAAEDGDGSGSYSISGTLRGHTKQVTALAGGVLKRGDKDVEIYSCGVDGEVLVWRKKNGARAADWQCVQRMSSEFDTTCVGIASLEANEGMYLAVSDAKANVLLWFKEHGSNDFKRFQSLKMPAQQTPHVLHFMLDGLPGSNILCLLVGGVDAKIHVLCSPSFSEGSPGHFSEYGVLSGHEEWITCLTSRKVGGDTTLLASGSKDFRTRVWRFVTRSKSESRGQARAEYNADDADADDDDDDDGDDIMDEEGAAGAALIDTEDNQASEARLQFAVGSVSCKVYLETLLVGHEDWVTSVQWLPESFSRQMIAGAGTADAQVCHLFTASMDRNMILWEGLVRTVSDDEREEGGRAANASKSQVWAPLTRIGDVGGMLGGSVGANLLGFSAAKLSPDGRALLGVGYGGSFHLYRFQNRNGLASVPSNDLQVDTGTDAEGEGAPRSTEYTRRAAPLAAPLQRTWRWMAASFLSGHFGAVNSLCWSPDGSYFVTTSSDQTSRLWAEMRGREGAEGGWRELSRPQVHGYDLNSVALVGTSVSGAAASGGSRGGGVPRLLSAGDEKMVRVYAPTKEVLRGLRELAGVRVDESDDGSEGSTSGVVSRAYIPELKLSTKPVSQISEEEAREMRARGVDELSWVTPPLEGQLSDFTVWREEHALFGHTNDIVCLAASEDGRWVASACKARNADTAAILVRDLSRLGDSAISATPLLGHDSTVTCLSFSGCGRYLASSGKDRSMCVFKRNDRYDESKGEQEQGAFTLLACVKGVHKRIVWGLSWLPAAAVCDGTDTVAKPMLVTASRDAVCKVWQLAERGDGHHEGGNPLQCECSFSPFDKTAVTAVACAPAPHCLLAVGSEAGDVSVWRWAGEGGEWGAVKMWAAPAHCRHGASVRCLAWRPAGPSNQAPLLASCGDDCTVRLHSPRVPE